MGLRPSRRHRRLDLKLAVAAIIVEPVGEVDILLDLDQGQPRPERMDGARRRVEEVARRGFAPVNQLFEAPVDGGGAKLGPSDFPFQPEPEPRSGLGLEHDPRLVLASAMPRRTRRFVVGMDLDRQLLAGQQIFDEQLRLGAAPVLEPDLTDRLAARGRAEAMRKLGAPPQFLDLP
jgi:hypothetical protein